MSTTTSFFFREDLPGPLEVDGASHGFTSVGASEEEEACAGWESSGRESFGAVVVTGDGGEGGEMSVDFNVELDVSAEATESVLVG